MNATQQALSTDTTLRLLADRRRRRILQALRDSEEAGTSLDELATTVTDSDAASARPSGAGRSEHVALYHVHLPKLAERQVITWDRERDVVKPGPAFGAVGSRLGLLRRHADQLPGYLSD